MEKDSFDGSVHTMKSVENVNEKVEYSETECGWGRVEG